MSKDIKLIKFNTGEEVICEVLKVQGDYTTFKNALTMVWNGKAIQAVPFSMNINDGQEIKVFHENIQFNTEPRKELIEQYKQQFSSIIAPSSSIIT